MQTIEAEITIRHIFDSEPTRYSLIIKPANQIVMTEINTFQYVVFQGKWGKRWRGEVKAKSAFSIFAAIIKSLKKIS